MNRLKLSIVDDDGNVLCKIGSSVSLPAGIEYSNAELLCIIEEIKMLLNEK